MNKSFKFIFSTLIVIFTITSVLQSQNQLVSVRIDSQEFIQYFEDETHFSFNVLILDAFTSTKTIKAKVEENSDIIKFGMSNKQDFDSGYRKSYMKVKGENRLNTFTAVLQKLGCTTIILDKEEMSLNDLLNNKEIKK